MQENEVLLSSGSVPWLGVEEAIELARQTGFDGIDLVPTRKAVSELEKLVEKYSNEWSKHVKNIEHIKGLHQSWRLDIGHDLQYGINPIISVLFILLRYAFFPSNNHSRNIISLLSKKFNLPVTVHYLSKEWTTDVHGKEFSGGIEYELLDMSEKSPYEIKKFLKKKNHSIVVDTRDDQSIMWAKTHGFTNWKEFWGWIGVEKISIIQLTLIGKKGIYKIFKKQRSLAEEQFLWLHEKGWEKTVVVEVNPVILFIATKGNLKQGFQTISSFIKTTLQEGNRWSFS